MTIVPSLRLLLILRLAVLLNRSRKGTEQPPVRVDVSEKAININFDADWLAANPLTIADLEREKEFLSEVGYVLAIR